MTFATSPAESVKQLINQRLSINYPKLLNLNPLSLFHRNQMEEGRPILLEQGKAAKKKKD